MRSIALHSFLTFIKYKVSLAVTFTAITGYIVYSGRISDIEITAKEIQKLKKELYEIIAFHSKQTYEKVWGDSDRDYWMIAEEAKAYGMIDEILVKNK